MDASGGWASRLPLRAGGSPAGARLTRGERLGVGAFCAVLVVFGGLVEMRSALLSKRMGDLDCFLRAAWAVRSGADLYDVTDDNGFHYNYPPLLAVLAAPLADPPAGADHAGMLPYAVSVALWYVLSLGCLALAVHRLAEALEETAAGGRPPAGCRRWWALRMWPVLACLVPIGHTLMRGQSNLIVLALLAATLADLLRGARFRAGLWLAGAACLKIFPAFLVLFPLWRRDGRCLAGWVAGLVVGLALVPSLVLGPARTVSCYRRLAEVLILPAFDLGTDDSRATELTTLKATDSQSIVAIVHNSLYPRFLDRPAQASPAVQRLAFLAGGLLTLLTLCAARRTARTDRVAAVLCFGLLVLDMLLLCPVCHQHYFALAVPLVLALIEERWRRPTGGTPVPPDRLWLGVGLTALFALGAVAQLLPQFPRLVLLRELGLPFYGALALWLVGIRALWRRALVPEVAVAGPRAEAA